MSMQQPHGGSLTFSVCAGSNKCPPLSAVCSLPLPHSGGKWEECECPQFPLVMNAAHFPSDCYMIGGKHWDGSWLSFLSVPASSCGLMKMWTGLSPPPSGLVSVESFPSPSHTSSSAEAPMGRSRSAGAVRVPVSELSLFSLSLVLLSEPTFSAEPGKQRTLKVSWRWTQRTAGWVCLNMASDLYFAGIIIFIGKIIDWNCFTRHNKYKNLPDQLFDLWNPCYN